MTFSLQSRIALSFGNVSVDGAMKIRLGFAFEPVVHLGLTDAPPLYSECLARIAAAEIKPINIGNVVNDLEQRGFISYLDVAMLELVLDSLAEDPDAVLGCNISPQTLAVAEEWQRVLLLITARAWLADRLVLEITESFPLNEIAGASAHLREAKRLGCRLAIDDFGAGFATPAFLYGVEVDWDFIKLDRSCFEAMSEAFSGAQKLRSIFRLATRFAPTVIVEGIETTAHLDTALSVGAYYGQGWLFEGTTREHWTVLEGQMGGRLAAALQAGGRLAGASPATIGTRQP